MSSQTSRKGLSDYEAQMSQFAKTPENQRQPTREFSEQEDNQPPLPLKKSDE